MNRLIEASFALCDIHNPGLGYQVKVIDAMTNQTLLFTSRDPITGQDLLTARQCVDVIDCFPPPRRPEPADDIEAEEQMEAEHFERAMVPQDYTLRLEFPNGEGRNWPIKDCYFDRRWHGLGLKVRKTIMDHDRDCAFALEERKKS